MCGNWACALWVTDFENMLKSKTSYAYFAALGWSQPCDVWSIGCILIEYYLGFTVFQVCTEA